MTVLVIAELTPAPGQEAALQQAVQALTTASRAEAGCLQYRPLTDPEHPGSVVIVEKWADATALEAHKQTPHMARFKADLENVEVSVEAHVI